MPPGIGFITGNPGKSKTHMNQKMNINADVNIPEPPGSQILVVLRCWPYGTVPIFYNCIILSTIFSQVIETKKFPEYDYAIGYSDLKEITKNRTRVS